MYVKQTMLLLGAVTCGTRQVSAIKRLAVGVIRGVGVGDALVVGIAVWRDTIGKGDADCPLVKVTGGYYASI